MKRIISAVIALTLLISCPARAESTEERFSAIETKLAEIEKLRTECETQGIYIGYETADIAVIRDFLKYGREDIAWGDSERAEYVADCLEKLCQKTENQLSGYLDGALKPLAFKKNTPDDFGGASDGNFVNKNGEPIFQNGYGAFDMVKDDVEKLPDFGADIIQFEIGPSAVLVPKGSINGWNVKVYGEADAKASIENEQGGKSLKITNNSSGADRYIAVRQSICVSPETSYSLSFNAKTLNSGNAFVGANGWNNGRVAIPSGTAEWKEFKLDYTTKENEYSIELMIISSSKTEELWLDNFRLCKNGTAENIVQNGDFENSQCPESEHFAVNTAQIKNRVTRTLDMAYKSGVMVNLLISPHYFPTWITEKYPEAAAPDCGPGYNINNQYAKEALELYIRAVAEEIRDHKALHSICISNEPKCDTRNSSDFKPEFSAYLQNEYADIAELNSVYKTAYASFDDVPMPADSYDAAYYDWICFNNAYVKSWHKFLADTVRKYAPDVPVHAKIMTIFGRKDFRNLGIDPEDIAEVCDWLGNDSWGFLGTDASGLISKLMWYDLLSSIDSSAPVINSEDHIIEDRNTNYSARQAAFVGADIWQGAIHGRDASVVWVWGRTSDKTANTYGNILYRPDVLSEVSRRSLDLNRLAGYAAAAQKSDGGISILYSPTSFAYRSDAVKNIAKVYEASLYSGTKAEFITERQLESGKMPKGVLAVPEITNISDSAFEAIKLFKQNGGKIITFGQCFGYDEHNRKRNEAVLGDISASLEADVNALAQLFAESAGSSIAGEYIEKREFEYNGKTVWNVCNYSWDKETAIETNAPVLDLITGKRYSGSVVLKPFVPMLLEFEKPEFSVFADVIRSGSVIRGIDVRIENVGAVGGYANAEILVNADGLWQRTDIKKFIPAQTGASAQVFCSDVTQSFSAKIKVYDDSGIISADELKE